MKAFVLRSYGPPDQLELTDVDTPVPAADQVLVRVRATSVNPYDWHHLRGEPRVARLMPGTLGLRAPKLRILGCDVAGQVEAVGRDVTEFRPGDDVFALLERGGGFAEYVSVPERLLARKPGNLSHEQAAAVPMAATTALLGLRDVGRIEAGQRVLVVGASGGVGTFAVQIARALGATSDAVCSSTNADLVRSVGADDVIDYAKTDFTRSGRHYDVLLDIAGGRTAVACRLVLKPRGTLVLIGGPAGRWLQPAGHVFAALAMAPLGPQRMAIADTGSHAAKKQTLTTLTALIEEGKVTPVIARTYPFRDIREAIRYQEQGHAPGKVVVTVLFRQRRESRARRKRPGPAAILLFAKAFPYTERGSATGRGGRMPVDWVVVGVDNGGTTNNGTVLDSAGRFLLDQMAEVPSNVREGPDKAIQSLVDSVERVLGLTGAPITSVRAIGLDTPGPASADGVISSKGATNFGDAGWGGFDIRGALAERLGLPVIYNNDGNAAALYAHHVRFGAEARRYSSVSAIVGTGLGGGLIEAGRVIKGAAGMAGELGHVPIPMDGLLDAGQPAPACNCGQWGDAESVASLTGIQKNLLPYWLSRYEHHELAGLPLDKAAKLVRRYGEEGDELALKIFRQQAIALGRLLTIAANFFDPAVYFLGGGVVEATPRFRDWFLAEVRAHTVLREEQARAAEISLVPDLDMAGARGSAIAARDWLLGQEP